MAVQQGTRYKVLAIESEVNILNSLYSDLNKNGIEFWGTSSIRDGLLAVEAMKPDVVILDANLPSIGSHEVCRRLNQEKSIPVIFITPELPEDKDIEGIDETLYEFLIKPYATPQLIARISQLGSRAKASALSSQIIPASEFHFHLPKRTGEDLGFAKLAAGFGQFLSLRNHEVLALYQAGYLHENKKSPISPELMIKDARLSAEEKAILQQHIGAVEFLRHRELERSVFSIFRYHHEHWDGSGYSQGLMGEKIPFLARIFYIVELYHALYENRQNKNITPKEIMDMLKGGRMCDRMDPFLLEEFHKFIKVQNLY